MELFADWRNDDNPFQDANDVDRAIAADLGLDVGKDVDMSDAEIVLQPPPTQTMNRLDQLPLQLDTSLQAMLAPGVQTMERFMEPPVQLDLLLSGGLSLPPQQTEVAAGTGTIELQLPAKIGYLHSASASGPITAAMEHIDNVVSAFNSSGPCSSVLPKGVSKDAIDESKENMLFVQFIIWIIKNLGSTWDSATVIRHCVLLGKRACIGCQPGKRGKVVKGDMCCSSHAGVFAHMDLDSKFEALYKKPFQHRYIDLVEDSS